jgi:hypothetical protein
VGNANEGLLGRLDKIGCNPQSILAGVDTKVFQSAQVFSLHAIDGEMLKFSEVNHDSILAFFSLGLMPSLLIRSGPMFVKQNSGVRSQESE